MITQRLETNLERGDGTLTVTCEPGSLAELIALADELNLRTNVRTDGPIHTLNDPADNGPPVIQ